MPRFKLFNEEEVLIKAMELFWNKGYHATSIQDLVSFLGINRASLYDTFGGKKELFDKSFALYRTINTNAIQVFFKNHPNVKIGLCNLFTMAINNCEIDKDKKGCFVVNTTTECTPEDKDIQLILQQNKTLFEGILYDYLVTGEQSGEIPKGKDLRMIATLLFTFFSGIKVVAKVETDEKLRSSIETILTLLD